MTEHVFLRGRDTGAKSAAPNTNYSAAKQLKLSSTAQIFVQFPALAQKVRGRVVISAVLYPHVVNGFGTAQSVSVKENATQWVAGTLTWNKRPTQRAATVTDTTGTVADDGRYGIEIGTLVQDIANGAPDYGFRLTTTSTSGHTLYSFETLDAWELHVELSDNPAPPTSLTPDAGAVGTAKPRLGWEWTDTGIDDDGTSTEQVALQVQIDPDADEVSPAFDTGEIASALPNLDLTTTAYAGLASGATTQWRVRVKDTGGDWSDWSDWATFTFRPKPTLTITSPSGDHLYDATTVIEAAIDSGSMKTYRVQIFNGSDRTIRRYNSGRIPASGLTFSHELPFKTRDGVRIFRDDASYWIRVVVEDRTDRVSTGDPADRPYLEVWKLITFDDDVIPAVTEVTASQAGELPRTRVHWKRAAGAADGWNIRRNGELIARLDPTDPDGDLGPVVVDPAGGWYWDDPLGLPYQSATYQVQPIVNGKQGPVGSKSATITLQPKGLWLIRANGDAVVLNGTGVSGFRTNDRRATYKPPGVGYDVDIITAFEGVTGQYAGTYSKTSHQSVHTPAQAYTRMRAIKARPEEEVTLVYGDVAVPVLLRHVTVLPAETFDVDSRRKDVTFEFFQSSEFEVTL